jgi:hypothetical protein
VDSSRELAKQVLSQLSYTPTVRDASILEYFRAGENHSFDWGPVD